MFGHGSQKFTATFTASVASHDVLFVSGIGGGGITSHHRAVGFCLTNVASCGQLPSARAIFGSPSVQA